MKLSEALGFLLFISGYMLGRIDSILKIFAQKSNLDDCSKMKLSNKIFSAKKTSSEDLSNQTDVKEVAKEVSKLSNPKRKNQKS